MAKINAIESFALKDCALAALATGKRAQNIRELREQLRTVHPGCIHYHFWGGLLRPRFDDPEYNNDFASWVRHCIHDMKLAEHLGIIDPAGFTNLEALRQELIEVIEERLDETEFLTWARRDLQFNFIRSQIIVFDTHLRIEKPKDLVAVSKKMSLGSVFYHFVDARRRPPHGVDDFRSWLEKLGDGYADLCAKLAALDPYFVTLSDLRTQLTSLFKDYFSKH